MNLSAPLVALAATAVLTLSACGADMSTAADEGSSQDQMAGHDMDDMDDMDSGKDSGGESSGAAGSHIMYDEYLDNGPEAYAGTAVVLYFDATWCPSCQATQEWLASHDVPEGLTLVQLDYDTALEEKQRYGITVQHSFVQIDANGDEIKKWTGSISGQEILAETV